MASNCVVAKDLPPDILLDILSRLPAKTLRKFLCISKSWSALISDPLFQRLHHQRSKQNPLLFIATVDVNRRGSIYERRKLVHSLLDKEKRTLDIVTSFPLAEGMYPSAPVFACMDLVCTYDGHNIYVCNPAVRKWITLPNTSSHYARMLEDCGMREDMREAMDDHWPLVALGYVASTSEYKVLRVYSHKYRIYSYDEIHGESKREGCSFKCEVFTLGFKCWRDVKSPPDSVVINYDGGMAIVDGAVYFLSHYLHQEETSDIIAVFDLNKEDWSVLPIPYHDIHHVGQELSNCNISLLETRGLLCLAYFVHDWVEKRKKLELWMQKDHGSLMWVKEYSIDTSSFPDYCLLAIEQDGRVLLHTSEYKQDDHTLTLEQKLQYYDPKDERFEEIYARKRDFFEEIYHGKHNFTTVTFYAESLRSLRIKSFEPRKEPRKEPPKEWRVMGKKHRRHDRKQANSNVHSVATKNQFLTLDEDEDEE